jgi:hypothetical protein
LEVRLTILLQVFGERLFRQVLVVIRRLLIVIVHGWSRIFLSIAMGKACHESTFCENDRFKWNVN